MYNIGDFVIYSNSGVCKVIDISKNPIDGLNPDKDYYTLEPLYDSVMIYAPVDTEVFMRNLLSADEIHELIDKINSIKVPTINTNNSTELSNEYRKLINSHKTIDLIRLIKSIRKKNHKAEKEGRRIGLTDMRYLRQAEELLFGEFSISLNIPSEDVVSYILQRAPLEDVFELGSGTPTRRDDSPREKRTILPVDDILAKEISLSDEFLDEF